ncbi:hypothetical protein ACH42_00880 [Endozoicomonas sp. (ex Bugula neritina AB1)]|nr:hypothetical protein ACH42_00880 [Endozoicomonas sp. (ex Bugula neritina AB1)]
MERLRTFFCSLWKTLPNAGLSSEYHPSINGGAIPIPFIVSQRILLDHPKDKLNAAPQLQPPHRSFTCYMQGYSSLPLRDRSLGALRSAYLAGARHLIPDIARCAFDTGLQASDITLATKGHTSPGWSRQEHLILRIAEDLYRNESISKHHWRELQKVYKPQQILDLMLCCAAFHLCVHPN